MGLHVRYLLLVSDFSETPLASTIARIKYHRTSVVSRRQEDEQWISSSINSQASGCSPHRSLESSWNVMAHGDAWEGKWRGNWRMEWVYSTLHTTSEHGVSSITTAEAHISAASSRLNWHPRLFKWTRPFRRKTKSGFCACAITFQTQSTVFHWRLFGTYMSLFHEGHKLHYRQIVAKLRISVYLAQLFPLFCELPVDHTPKNLLCISYYLRSYWRS